MLDKDRYFILENDFYNCAVNRESGELVSFYLSKRNEELVHGGGKFFSDRDDCDSIGWKKSEITMFPIIGPTSKDNDICYDGRKFIMNQHGISRGLDWKFDEEKSDDKKIVLSQSFDEGQEIPNLKYKKDLPESQGNNKFQIAPFSASLEKRIEIFDEGLCVSHLVTNKSEDSISYMIGQHPAFKMLGSFVEGRLSLNNFSIYNFDDVISGNPLFIENENAIRYYNRESDVGFNIETSGYKHFMVWTPDQDSRMFCVEPVNSLPSAFNPDLEDLKKSEIMEILDVDESREYFYKIKPFVFIST